MDGCATNSEMCDVNLITLGGAMPTEFQEWKRVIRDEVDNWFTLYNAKTQKYLAVVDEAVTSPKVKSMRKHYHCHTKLFSF